MKVYPYEVNKPTLEKIIGYTVADWTLIIKSALHERPIEIYLSFTNSLPSTVLTELYLVLIKYRIPSTLYQQSLINTFLEYYPFPENVLNSQCLIHAIDFCRPSTFYKLLENYAISEEYEYMERVSCESDYSIRYQLINAIMEFGVESSSMENFFLVNSNSKNVPEFYQAGVRYFLKKSEPEKLSTFLNQTAIQCNDNEILVSLKFAIDELVIENYGFKLIYNWIIRLEEDKNKLIICNMLFEWLEEAGDEFIEYPYFSSFYLFVGTTLREKLNSYTLIKRSYEDVTMNEYDKATFFMFVAKNFRFLDIDVQPLESEYLELRFIGQNDKCVKLIEEDIIMNFNIAYNDELRNKVSKEELVINVD